MDQKELREQLQKVIDSGLIATAIAKNTGISYDILAKFKREKLCLIPDDAERLRGYLDKVVIP